MQTVELLLDAEADAVVRAEWQRLAERGLPSQALHQGATNAPHITLAVAKAIPADVERAIAGAVRALPLPVELGPLVVFGSRRLALARLVVPEPGLLRLHADLARVMAACPGVPGYLLPGHWTPHVTLARGLGPAQVGQAIELLGAVGALAATAPQARRWDSDQRRAWLV